MTKRKEEKQYQTEYGQYFVLYFLGGGDITQVFSQSKLAGRSAPSFL